jgi:hypothetical protein
MTVGMTVGTTAAGIAIMVIKVAKLGDGHRGCQPL